METVLRFPPRSVLSSVCRPTDLDWVSWVLHPNAFIFTECLGCHCHRKEEGPPPPLWLRECGLGQASGSPGAGDPKQVREAVCSPVTAACRASNLTGRNEAAEAFPGTGAIAGKEISWQPKSEPGGRFSGGRGEPIESRWCNILNVSF